MAMKIRFRGRSGYGPGLRVRMASQGETHIDCDRRLCYGGNGHEVLVF